MLTTIILSPIITLLKEQSMLRVLKNENLSVVRLSDCSTFTGYVSDIESSHLTLQFDADVDLNVGDQVQCKFERDGSQFTAVADVEEISGQAYKLAVMVTEIVPAVERAPRAVAPGATVSITYGSETIIGSLCDLSESGLRVRSLGDYEVGQEIQLKMESETGTITFSGRIARVVPGVDAESCDAGIQILEMARLDRARYNHYVDGLLRKSKRVA